MTTTISAPLPTITIPATELADQLRGDLWLPHDDGWDLARAAWNAAVDQRPAMVAAPVDAGDVMAIVQFARRHGLKVAAQGTGHNAAALAELDGTILISTRRMRGVDIDVGRRRARVRAGALWSEVTDATTPYGLFPLSGSSPNVGVVGYTLGGGLSWLGRRHGLAANHVTAIEVVAPNGVLVRATSTEHPELFWALRGGGGNFGVVTALEIELFAYDSVYAGMFLWPYDRHLDVLHAWRDWTRTAPETATTSLRVMHFPPLEELPPFLAGRSVVVIDGAVAADEAEADSVVGPFRRLQPELDTWGPSTPADLSHVHMDPEPPTPVRSDTMLLDDLDDAALAAFAAAVGPASGLTVGEIRHLGGALGRAPAGAGALGCLPGRYLLYAGAIVPSTEAGEAADRALAAVRAAMAPHHNGRVYGNFAERPVDAACLYDDEVHSRLRHLRDVVDPDALMVASHPVPRLRREP